MKTSSILLFTTATMAVAITACNQITTDLDLAGAWSATFVVEKSLRDDCPFPAPAPFDNAFPVTITQTDHRFVVSAEDQQGTLLFLGSVDEKGEFTFGGNQFITSLPTIGFRGTCPIDLTWENAWGTATDNLIEGVGIVDGQIQGQSCYPYNRLFCRFDISLQIRRQ